MHTAVTRQILAWTTAAVCMRHRLILTGNCPAAVTAVFAQVEAYQIRAVSDAEGISVPLASCMTDFLPCEQKWALLKELAVGLRWAYLNQLELHELAATYSDDTPAPRLVIFSTPDRSVTIDRTSSPCADEQTAVVLQGGAPASWFLTNTWQTMRPAWPVAANHVLYPLSVASYFDSCYNNVLRRVGAKMIGSGMWEPPLATSSDDMQSFVQTVQPAWQGVA